MKKKMNKGQSLVEILVALGIALLVVLALVKVTTVSIKNAGFSRDQAKATAYAEEAVEWSRNERDASWTTFSGRSSAGGSTYCLANLSWVAGACSSSGFISGTSFIRQAILKTVIKDSRTLVEAKVVVSWQEAGRTHQSELQTYFTNLQEW